MSRPSDRSHRAYRRRRDALKAKAQRENLPCWLCTEDIDFGAHHLAPEAFSADHVEAVATGGDAAYGELRPAHRACNQMRGEAPAYPGMFRGRRPLSWAEVNRITGNGGTAPRPTASISMRYAPGQPPLLSGEPHRVDCEGHPGPGPVSRCWR